MLIEQLRRVTLGPHPKFPLQEPANEKPQDECRTKHCGKAWFYVPSSSEIAGSEKIRRGGGK
jgi:hypothetical protein